MQLSNATRAGIDLSSKLIAGSRGYQATYPYVVELISDLVTSRKLSLSLTMEVIAREYCL